MENSVPDRLLHDKDVIELGELKLEVLHTPGHSPGGVCLFTEDLCFSGDTLFQAGYGRTGTFFAAEHEGLKPDIITLGKGIGSGAPVSAVCYKCVVTRTDIPWQGDQGALNIRSLMRIRLMKRYDPTQFTLSVLTRDHGVCAVRGPRGVPRSLSEALA